jgi:hypothetical protein
MGSDKGSSIPDFGKYMSKKGEGNNKLFSYFMVGTMGALSAAGAKSTVQGMSRRDIHVRHSTRIGKPLSSLQLREMHN